MAEMWLSADDPLIWDQATGSLIWEDRMEKTGVVTGEHTPSEERCRHCDGTGWVDVEDVADLRPVINQVMCDCCDYWVKRREAERR